ncbi:MAG: hypothetical protein KDJ52_04370 [Anaerolineae bacterium]|nr:hypothetical protein [Anaerolineae bacterium]
MTTAVSPTPMVRALERLRSTFWQRRVLHWTVRAAWIALLVPTIVMAGYLWAGWRIPWLLWVALALLAGFASMIWSMRPINLQRMTRRLDQLLGLRSQLITALEISHNPGASAYIENPVTDRLVQEAVSTTADIRRRVKLLGRGFWLEFNMLMGIAFILAALLVLDALTPRLPDVPIIDLPALGTEPNADQIIPPDPVLNPPLQDQLQSMSQQQIQAALQELADALRDQGATRAIAEAIDQGDLGGAAEEMRRLADRLGELSPQAQQALGQSLQEAADNIGGEAPPFTNPLQSGNQSLQTGNLPGATQALEDLAELLDTLDGSGAPDESQSESEGESEQPGESGESDQPSESEESGDQQGGGDGAGEGEDSGEGDQPLGEEEERLPIDGEPLEIESETDIEDRVLQPSELDAETDDDRRTSDSPFARQPLNATGDDLGPDPLSYPWEKRDIIRQYFTP